MKISSRGDKMLQTSLASCPRGRPTANYRPAIFCRRSPAAAYSLGIKSPVEVSGRGRDGSEEERQSGRDGTATAATCPAVLRGEARPWEGGAQLPAVDLGCSAGAGRRPIIRQAAGHRQVADEMMQRVDAADEAAKRTVFAWARRAEERSVLQTPQHMRSQRLICAATGAARPKAPEAKEPCQTADPEAIYARLRRRNEVRMLPSGRRRSARSHCTASRWPSAWHVFLPRGPEGDRFSCLSYMIRPETASRHILVLTKWTNSSVVVNDSISSRDITMTVLFWAW